MQSLETMTMVFRHKDGHRVKIGAAALSLMCQYRQIRVNQTEAGGILLGRLVEGCSDVIVDEVTVPISTDRRSRFKFFRRKHSAQRRVISAWTQTKQTRNYLGEWHTHPEDDPTPSEHDIANWRQIVTSSRFEQDSLLFLIVGRVTTRAWSLRKNERMPVELQADSKFDKHS